MLVLVLTQWLILVMSADAWACHDLAITFVTVYMLYEGLYRPAA